MDKSIYLSSINAGNLLQAQTTHAHNLANINTNAFKRDFVQFKSQEIPQQMLKMRANAIAHIAGSDFSNGAIMPTGRALDMAINGEGWFAVQTPSGEEAYTRTGNFKVNSDGLLSTESNLLILGEGGPIAIPENARLDMGNDGTISIQTGSGNQTTTTIVDRLKLVKPELTNLIKGNDGLIRVKDGKAPEPDSTVNIMSGCLESSNVNAVSEISQMIALARQFEINLKMMESIQENEQSHNKILSLS